MNARYLIPMESPSIKFQYKGPNNVSISHVDSKQASKLLHEYLTNDDLQFISIRQVCDALVNNLDVIQSVVDDVMSVQCFNRIECRIRMLCRVHQIDMAKLIVNTLKHRTNRVEYLMMMILKSEYVSVMNEYSSDIDLIDYLNSHPQCIQQLLQQHQLLSGGSDWNIKLCNALNNVILKVYNELQWNNDVVLIIGLLQLNDEIILHIIDKCINRHMVNRQYEQIAMMMQQARQISRLDLIGISNDCIYSSIGYIVLVSQIRYYCISHCH